MKIRLFILRGTLILGAAILLAVLSACSTPAQPNQPGPHQGNGVRDGKDGHDYKGHSEMTPAVGTTGPHQNG